LYDKPSRIVTREKTEGEIERGGEGVKKIKAKEKK